MRNRRSGVGVIAHGDYVYAVGGFNGITRMNSAERYSVRTNQWTSIPEMYNPRSNFAIEVKYNPPPSPPPPSTTHQRILMPT